MKKRGLLVGVLISLLLVSMISIVSADPLVETGSMVDEFVDWIRPIAERILGTTPDGQFLFAKVLLLFMIFAIVYAVLSRVNFFEENGWVLIIVSIATTVLSTRWLTTESLIRTIILPYSTLGIVITAGLPFVIYFLIVNGMFSGPGSRTIRRIAWVAFAVVFAGLWVTRRADLLAEGSKAGYMYPAVAIAALVMIMLDGTYQRLMERMKAERKMSVSQRRYMIKLEKELDECHERFAKDGSSYKALYSTKAGAAGYAADKKAIMDRLEKLGV